MVHLGTKRIETERLILRPFIPEDAVPMFKNWAGDPEVTKYLTWPAHPDLSVTQKVIGKWIERYDDPAFYQWAVELKSIQKPIGSISGVKFDISTCSTEIGYCIGRSWWGQGIVAEAVRELFEFFFDEVGVNEIRACHHPDNPNSGRVMQKCGMTYEGTWYQEDKGRTLCWYSITREGYLKNK